MTTFTLLTQKQFSARAGKLGGHRKALIDEIQELAIQAVYAQAFNQKADYANVLAAKVKLYMPRDYKHVVAFLSEFCANLRRTTQADKESDTKAFLVKKGTKPHDSKNEAEVEASDAIADLPLWDTWAKEKASEEKPAEAYDFLKAFTGIIDRAAKKDIKPEQSFQFHALTSFLDLILQGKSLADVKAEIAADISAKHFDAIAAKNAA